MKRKAKPIETTGDVVHVNTPVDWPAEMRKLRAGAEIELHVTSIDEDAVLALVAGAWNSYAFLQALVSAGIVTPKWASASFQNAVQYACRQMIYEAVAHLLNTRSNPE